MLQKMKTESQQNIQNVLLRKLEEYREINPLFSVRALAKKLDMQPSATNEILKGQRRVSIKLATRIADKLMLDPSERSELLSSFPSKLLRNTTYSKKRDHEMELVKLNMQQFQVISKVIHYSILSLLKTKSFRSDVNWMATRLQEKVTNVKNAISNLTSLGLVKQTEDGEITRTCTKVNTTDDILSLSIQKSHIQDMEMAKEKLVKVDVENRDFTSLTMPVDLNLLPKAKEIIRRAQDEIYEMMENAEADEVYRLTTYLYPLTDTTHSKKTNMTEKEIQ